VLVYLFNKTSYSISKYNIYLAYLSFGFLINLLFLKNTKSKEMNIFIIIILILVYLFNKIFYFIRKQCLFSICCLYIKIEIIEFVKDPRVLVS